MGAGKPWNSEPGDTGLKLGVGVGVAVVVLTGAGCSLASSEMA